MTRDNKALLLLLVGMLIILGLSLMVTAQPLDVNKWFFPSSGWFGDVENIGFTQAWAENPHSGPVCTQIIYRQPGIGTHEYAGIYWLYPDSNWGESPGRDLSRYENGTLRFYARGNGLVEFRVGGIKNDTAKKSLWQTLSPEWEEYHIDLIGPTCKDLSNISGGFCVVADGTNNTRGCAIYLDDIFYYEP